LLILWRDLKINCDKVSWNLRRLSRPESWAADDGCASPISRICDDRTRSTDLPGAQRIDGDLRAMDIKHRSRAQHVAKRRAPRCARGDFSLPMFIHNTVPPGVATMKHLKDQITYTAEKTARGAQVRITTRSPQALISPATWLRLGTSEPRILAWPIAGSKKAMRQICVKCRYMRLISS
jgi:hypothetical protein